MDSEVFVVTFIIRDSMPFLCQCLHFGISRLILPALAPVQVVLLFTTNARATIPLIYGCSVTAVTAIKQCRTQ